MGTERSDDFKYRELDKNLRIMEAAEAELERQRGEAVFCLTVFVSAMSVWILLVALWDMLGRPIAERFLTYGVELIAGLMLVVVLKFTRLDIHRMGITKKNLLPSLIRSALISAVIFALMLAVKLITKPGQPILNLTEFTPTYVLTSILQEFLARGFLLTTLCSIIPSRNSEHIAVFCSSLMFTSLHLYYGFPFMAGAGLLSVLLGYCYLKDRNIWGVSLIHFVIGMGGIMLELV